MNPEDFAGMVAGQRPRRSYVAVLGFAAITMAATSAVLTWNESDFRDASTESARVMCESGDPVARCNAIVVLLRDARDSIEVLRRIEQEGGVGAEQAKLALAQMEMALR